MAGQIKILIGDDSAENGIACANYLKGCGFKILTRPKDGKIIFDTIMAELPDVVVFDVLLPHIDAVELMSRVNSSGIKRPDFIVSTGYEHPIMERQLMENGASAILLKPYELKTLSNKIVNIRGSAKDKYCGESYINTMANNTENDMKIIVTDIIHQIGIPAHIKGYHYLREAILISVYDTEMFECITKVLYPTVAEKFTTTPTRVERAIRHAIEIGWKRGDSNVWNAIFTNAVDINMGKPTNSEFIALIADKLRLKYKDIILKK